MVFDWIGRGFSYPANSIPRWMLGPRSNDLNSPSAIGTSEVISVLFSAGVAHGFRAREAAGYRPVQQKLDRQSEIVGHGPYKGPCCAPRS